jgi:hypothetical protein
MAEPHVHGPNCDHDHNHDHGGHVHGPDCGHDHDHAHAHPPARLGEYYLEQLLTIFACGAFGVVAVLMYYNTDSKGNPMLKYILANTFWPWVLSAGFVLLALALVRGIVVWKQAGAVTHAHGDDCGDDHGDCGHDHAPGEAHSHGNIYWRVLVLAFPVLLFLMGLPNASLSKEWLGKRIGKDSIGKVADVEAKDGVVSFAAARPEDQFAELNSWAADPAKRQEYEGKTIQVKGQMRKVSDREFTLFNLKMTCCASDMVPLEARILSEFAVTSIDDYAWVEVRGKLQFAKAPGKRGGFIPVIRVASADGLQKTSAD